MCVNSPPPTEEGSTCAATTRKTTCPGSFNSAPPTAEGSTSTICPWSARGTSLQFGPSDRGGEHPNGQVTVWSHGLASIRPLRPRRGALRLLVAAQRRGG